MDNIPKLETVDAEQLISTPLRSIPFTVKSLIAQGVYLLVGDPKIGKSWFVLWLCLQIAKGEPIWRYDVRTGIVLYLCLEDNLHRVQSRLLELTDSAPDTLHFACVARNIATGLPKQIDDFMEEHPTTTFIVIDTLQKVRGAALDKAGAYASDYNDLGVIKSLADKHGISILLVHHTSKRPYEKDDPFKQISGTTAIMGAVDGCIMMTKDSVFKTSAILAVTGRDVEQRLMKIEQETNHIWSLVEDGAGEQLKKVLVPPIIRIICEFIQNTKCWRGTATDLISTLSTQINEQILPQTLTATMNKHNDILIANSILYQTKRTANQRIIFLEHNEVIKDNP